MDSFLEALDDELAQVGASRGEGMDVKSVARLVGPQGWPLENIAPTFLAEQLPNAWHEKVAYLSYQNGRMLAGNGMHVSSIGLASMACQMCVRITHADALSRMACQLHSSVETQSDSSSETLEIPCFIVGAFCIW